MKSIQHLDKGRSCAVEKLLGTTNTRNTVLSIERGSWHRFSDEAQKYQRSVAADRGLFPILLKYYWPPLFTTPNSINPFSK